MPLINLGKERLGCFLKSTTFESINSVNDLKELINCLHNFFRDYTHSYEKYEEEELKKYFSDASYRFFSNIKLVEHQYSHIASSLGIGFEDREGLLTKFQNKEFKYPIEMGFRAWLGILNFDTLKIQQDSLDAIYKELRPIVLFANRKLYELNE
ncbi:MAG: hypothetical protein IM574_10580 [Cytophagales bacterium]|jgi:hypothetical protein|nr:hypothetical protein [Cytophagales bacterium]MCA6390730.1 hypothetical protein [Cytophagales bacterium]MCA6396987.1 hypothetical protein [Cytophagales bacterium]MCA6403942.1 hypothetical protein [Cytophagales bacterium]MCA6405808.1 hypothetical protein [Cytophagales bacterium]